MTEFSTARAKQPVYCRHCGNALWNQLDILDHFEEHHEDVIREWCEEVGISRDAEHTHEAIGGAAVFRNEPPPATLMDVCECGAKRPISILGEPTGEWEESRH